ncbi:MAG: protein-disulfide reductase DsbD [Halieaceae bacterium]
MRIVIALALLILHGAAYSQDSTPASGALALPAPVTLGGGDPLAAMQEPEFLPVDEAYQLALEIVDPLQIRLYWQIEDGYYLYQKRFSFELEQAGTSVALTPRFPEGVVREDEYFGISEVHYLSADIYLDLASPIDAGLLKITSQGCADAGLCYPPQRQQFEIDFSEQTIAAVASSRKTSRSEQPLPQPSPQPFSASTLLYMMLLAFMGGSILNLMPCVFPVLSLKVFAFATGSDHAKHVHGWVYAAGVVSSFVLVASLLIALQHAGAAVGWGFQLQSPRFVAVLAYLFFIMGLSLSGLIELGASFMGTGSKLAERGGYSGSFFTGVLATVVASPCTAPFMGTALGFALTQPAPVALAVFAALGSGMAAPMLLLSYSKALRARMPRPGPWMETFKQLLAFPLYATAIWLLWVSGRQTSVTSMAILLFGMLSLALGLWLWRYRPWGRLAGILALIAALLVIPSPVLQSGQVANGATAADSEWSEQELLSLLAAGTPVFVNVTADWCITCIANERSTLSDERVLAEMSAMGAEYLVVDWTNYDANIAAFLARYGRNGVPLYLVYSGKADAEPQILPQLLTPDTVLEALAQSKSI